MLNISNIQNSSLNDAFELILKIFNEERKKYENTISSLKAKISELEDSLLLEKKENMLNRTRISKLKGKIRSISKTVSKLEESDFEIKFDNNKDALNNISNNNTNINNCNFNTIKYRNTDTFNSFRRKSKIIVDINNNTINMNKNDSNNHYLKMNFFDNNKVNNNGEDIPRCNKKKIHKKTLSTKIKNSILNINNPPELLKRKNGNNNIYKSQCYNDEDVSIFLLHNLNDNDSLNKMTLPADNDRKIAENRKKYLGRDKYNKIEQKIKGLKSSLTIHNKSENNKNSSESFPNSFNMQNIISK